MHRWILLELEEAKELIKKGELDESRGYHSVVDGKEVVEYHVDDHESFLERGSKLHRFGGLLSVRMPPDVLPIIVLGQDGRRSHFQAVFELVEGLVWARWIERYLAKG